MDEPLSALDKQLREELQLEIKRLHKQLGITFIYVTHDQREALVMSNRIAVINHGRAWGTRSCSRPIRLASISVDMISMPVIFPPGRL